MQGGEAGGGEGGDGGEGEDAANVSLPLARVKRIMRLAGYTRHAHPHTNPHARAHTEHDHFSLCIRSPSGLTESYMPPRGFVLRHILHIILKVIHELMR